MAKAPRRQVAKPANDMTAAFEVLRTVAQALSPALLIEIERIGPLAIAPREDGGVADQLYVAVVGQQLSVKAADTIWGRIVAAAAARGDALPALFVPGHEELLRTAGVSRNKIKALQAIRTADMEGRLDRHRLATLPSEERAAELRSIWGVGKWTADMLGIFYFLDHDIWPDGDVAATGILRRITGRDDTTEIAALFAPYRSILARYLWLSRDRQPAPEPPP